MAGAQSTPSTYCAALPPISCEVLNVDLGGAWFDGIGGNMAVIVKECVNQHFVTRIVQVPTFPGTMLSPLTVGDSGGGECRSSPGRL